MACKWIRIFFILLFVVSFASCENRKPGTEVKYPTVSFNSETLKIPDGGVRKVRGQVLYMPVYSNIPFIEGKDFDLSAFLAVHNTDLKHQIKITKVMLFNTEGRIVKNFILEPRILNPFATEIFTILKEDQSGRGANFLVEWMADQPVNEPLIESIMKDLSGNKGLSFLSLGRVIREIQ